MSMHEGTQTTQESVTPTAKINVGANMPGMGNAGPGVDDDHTPIMTFGMRRVHKMTSGLGSEHLNKFIEGLKEIYRGEDSTGYKIDIAAIDNAVKTNFPYSTVTVSVSKENKAAYFTIILEGTGRKPLAPSAVLQAFNAGQQAYGNIKRDDFYVTSDVIDSVLHNEIISTLKKKAAKDTIRYYTVDSMIIPWYQDDLSPAALRPIASTAFNACIVQIGKLNKEFRDLNITAAKEESPGSYLNIESSSIPTTTVDASGKPIRADWRIDLASVDANNANKSLNLQNNRNTVASVTGFVDAMPIDVPNTAGVPYGQPATSSIRFRPHIILTNMDTDMPTTGYALLSLVSSMVMLKPEMWLAAVAPKATDPYHDSGMLNLHSNLENKEDGIGDPIDLKDPSLTSNDVYRLLKQMFSLDPMVSMDIDVAGANSNFTSVFSVASAPGNSSMEAEAKANAANEIIVAANWLTNGAFPLEFNPAEIFLGNGIVIPTGRWIDNNGTARDLRDIDLAMVAQQTKDVAVMNSWVLSNVPAAMSGVDPYMTKVEVISKAIPNAEVEISGKATRVTFSPKFLDLLARCATTAGLETRYNPEVDYTEQSTLAAIGGYLHGAGVSQDAAGFARTFQGGGHYQTPFAAAGYNRFRM